MSEDLLASYRQKLDAEVEKHNDLLRQVNEAKAQVQQGEQALLQIQGRASTYKDLVDELEVELTGVGPEVEGDDTVDDEPATE